MIVFNSKTNHVLSIINYQLSIINYQLILMKMENKNNTVLGKILKVAITVLTALATVLGIQACS